MNKEIKEAEKVEEQIKEKPVAIRIAEFKASLAQAIVEAKLPPCIMEPIVSNIYDQVCLAASKEYEVQLQIMKKEEG